MKTLAHLVLKAASPFINSCMCMCVDDMIGFACLDAN